MVTKNMTKKVIALAIATALTHSLVADARNPINMLLYKENPWKFMEHTFVTKPEEKVRGWTMFFAKHGAIVAGSLPGTVLGADAARRGDRSRFGLLEAIVGIPTLVAGPIVSYKVSKHYLERYFYYKALQDVVANWKLSKNFVPEELHEIFEGMASQYKAKKWKYLWSVAPEVVENIKHAVYAQFTEKYAHRLKAHDTPKELPEKILDEYKMVRNLSIVGGLALLGAAGIAGYTAYLDQQQRS